MKNLLALALLFVSISINAEMRTATKDLACDSIDVVISELKNYGENPIIMGKTSVGSTVITTLNPKTSTWTIIEVIDKLACVLAVGEGIKLNQEFFKKETSWKDFASI